MVGSYMLNGEAMFPVNVAIQRLHSAIRVRLHILSSSARAATQLLLQEKTGRISWLVGSTKQWYRPPSYDNPHGSAALHRCIPYSADIHNPCKGAERQ